MIKNLVLAIIFVVSLFSLCYADGFEIGGKNVVYNEVSQPIIEERVTTVISEEVAPATITPEVNNEENIVEEVVVAPDPATIRNSIIEEHIARWKATVLDRYDTEYYSVLYMSQYTPYGVCPLILFVNNDGVVKYLHHYLDTNNLYYTSSVARVTIDKENQTITFVDNANGNTYKFDLANAKMISAI